jgi:hypothetical protein
MKNVIDARRLLDSTKLPVTSRWEAGSFAGRKVSGSADIREGYPDRKNIAIVSLHG